MAVVDHNVPRSLDACARSVPTHVRCRNGTQHMFYDDGRVLFFSIHRYDHGLFYPCSKDADCTMVGRDAVASHSAKTHCIDAIAAFGCVDLL